MPNYSIRAPNGQTYSISGPEGATDDQVRQQVMAQHPDAANAPTHAAAPAAPAGGSYPGLRPDQARAMIDQHAPSDPTIRARYLRDPRIVELNRIANQPAPVARPAPVQSIQQRQQQSAQQASNQNVASTGNFLTALKGGLMSGAFGIPEHLLAAGERWLPSAITGNTTNASYGQILNQVRQNDSADQSKSLAGNLTGQVWSGALAGGGAGKLIGAGARALSATGSPIAAGVGNVLQNLSTLRKGQKLANAGKIILGGTAAGAAQAAGTGEDVVKGAEYGAAGAAVIGGGAKFLHVVAQPVADILHLSTANQIISRFTTASRESIEARIAQYRANGIEPTLFEVLPLADRNRLLEHTVAGRDNLVEQTAGAVSKRAANLGPEMSNRANQVLANHRGMIHRSMLDDLATARGGQNAPEDVALAANAMKSPTDMLTLRDAEAKAHMAPHQNTPAADNLVELMPHVLGTNDAGETVRVGTDPEVAAQIRAAAGPITKRPDDVGVSAGEISSMIINLRKSLGSDNPLQNSNVQNAIDHLTEELHARAPEAAAAHQNMTDAYAARSRMAEGMDYGKRTVLRDPISTGTNDGKAQVVKNAFDTPEGAAGRVLGQSNAILHDLGGSPDEALAATVNMARGSTSRELSANVGDNAAAKIMSTAKLQDQSAEALSSAVGTAANSGNGADVGANVAHAIVGLHPGSFITTKANSIKNLIKATYIPESRARTIIDMIMSQDPALRNKALTALEGTKGGSSWIRRMSIVGGTIAGGQQSGSSSSGPPAGIEPDLNPGGDASGVEPNVVNTDPSAEPDALPPLPDSTPGDPSDDPSPDEGTDGSTDESGGGNLPAAHNLQVDPNRPYGRQVIEHLFPGVHINEDVRDPNSKLGKENPHSLHITTQNAVDVRPIPGMTFKEFIQHIQSAGFHVVQPIDEVTHPSRFATGKHWHLAVM